MLDIKSFHNQSALGRQAGDRPKSDKLTPMVLKLVREGESYRKIAAELRLSKNTVMAIVKRGRIQA